jgi:hypothetical protein
VALEAHNGSSSGSGGLLVVLAGVALVEVARITLLAIPFTEDNRCTDKADPITCMRNGTALREGAHKT